MAMMKEQAKRFIREFPMYLKPFIPFPLNKLIPFRVGEPVIFREQRRYSTYDEEVPHYLSTPRARFEGKVTDGILFVLTLATAYNVYLYATKQPTIFQRKK